MAERVMARVCWVRPEDGGRRTGPPAGPRYSTAARFERAREVWPCEAWSVVLDLIPPLDNDLCQLACARMLVENAPGGLLVLGSVFDLFEGDRLVAHCTVIAEDGSIDNNQ